MTPSVPVRLVALDVPDAGAFHVLIVAADPLARAGLAVLLDGQAGYTIAGTTDADDLDAALEAFQPDVALWDVGAGPGFDGDEAVLQAADLPIVALLPDASLVAEAWAFGARGLLLRDAAPALIAAALVSTWQGLVVIDPSLAEAVLSLREDLPEIEELTPRESEVLALMAEGLSNKLIADRLAISENTVKFHIGAILSKLGAHSRTEAVVRAARLGLLII